MDQAGEWERAADERHRALLLRAAPLSRAAGSTSVLQRAAVKVGVMYQPSGRNQPSKFGDLPLNERVGERYRTALWC